MECAARNGLVVAVERRKEAHYKDRTRGTKSMPFALEIHGTLSTRSDRYLIGSATLASCAGLSPPTSMVCTLFHQRVSIALHRSLAHTIYARFIHLEGSVAL